MTPLAAAVGTAAALERPPAVVPVCDVVPEPGPPRPLIIRPPRPELVVPPDLVVVATVADGKVDVLVPTTRTVEPWALVVRVTPIAEESELIVTLPPLECLTRNHVYTACAGESTKRLASNSQRWWRCDSRYICRSSDGCWAKGHGLRRRLACDDNLRLALRIGSHTDSGRCASTANGDGATYAGSESLTADDKHRSST